MKSLAAMGRDHYNEIRASVGVRGSWSDDIEREHAFSLERALG